MSKTYSTRTEAEKAIVTAIEATGVVEDACTEFDIDGIAQEAVYTLPGEGPTKYTVLGDGPDDDISDVATFWGIVADNARLSQ